MSDVRSDLAVSAVSISLPGSVRLRVREIDAEEQPHVHIASADEAVSAVEVDGVLRVRSEQARGCGGDYVLDVAVREPIDLKVAAVRVEVESDVELGRVDLAGAKVAARLGVVDRLKSAAKAGRVEVAEIAGKRAFFASASAEVSVGRSAARVESRTGFGALRIGRLDGPLSARSATGTVEVGSANGDVDVRSGAGAVRIGVREQLPTWLDLYTGTGSVDVRTPPSDPPADGDRYVTVRVATGTGNILIHRADDPAPPAPDPTGSSDDGDAADGLGGDAAGGARDPADGLRGDAAGDAAGGARDPADDRPTDTYTRIDEGADDEHDS
ncbi:DUF4097 family beta strand repeat-containing protein [Cumulibacter manganitolerans]|uniref:hypothetical protein n=1 Tax=Cumulibacter manganitolerans TaxID=1884992 RepID=UPI001297C8B4|nr:hypothetical protein [Cumulibacter manganitolerans]